jgi:hypothetical protein
MSRPASGGFVLGFAAEIAIVVAAVSLLPRIDLSGGRTLSADNTGAVQPLAALHETSHYESPRNETLHNETTRYERRTEPAAPRSFGQAPASLPPRLAYAPQPTPEPATRREPPPLIAVDPARPAYVEQRLDRASQDLVNGLGSYVTTAAQNLLTPAPPRRDPLPPAPVPYSGSFATQPPREAPPRLWSQY